MSEENIPIGLLRNGNDTVIRLAAILEPWAMLRPEKVYYGMTIQQFHQAKRVLYRWLNRRS